MGVAPLPDNESERLRALLRLQVLDTPVEEAFDEITSLAARRIGAPICLVSLIDARRQWFKSCYGFDLRETKREVAFCAHALAGKDVLVVEDTTKDSRFADNPFVTMSGGIRSYCGAPLALSGGVILGTLCVVDREVRRFSRSDVELLQSLARLVVHLLEMRLGAKEAFDRERASTLAAESESAERRAELLASENHLLDVAENIPGIVYQYRTNPDGKPCFTYVSRTVVKYLGIEAAEMTRNASALCAMVHPEDLEGLMRSIAQSQAELKAWQWEGRLLRRTGEVGWFRGASVPRLLRDGAVVWNGLFLDITEQRQIEERLRQAQKMEAVGQLTGGIAHDFNNLLAVIQGNAELLVDELGEEDSAVASILRVSQRGSDLTQRLLAFSRQQPLAPQVVDLSALICGMTDWLRRLLGSNIVISACAAPDLWSTSVDPGEAENTILNLALNARDAMPEGGRLCISVENASFGWESLEVPAGDYVRLGVRDCGLGMSAAVRARAFEPFFTTKAEGRGSGLGLSMAYGFARQSGGQISISSQPGKGTEVSLFLPKAEGAPKVAPGAAPLAAPGAAPGAAPLAAPGAAPGAAPREEISPASFGKGERILLLEDEDEVRRLVERMLVSAGYRVTAVAEVGAARCALRAVEDFRLLVSDVMLPGDLDGPGFAAEARRAFPGLGVVFMSGLAARVVNGSDPGLMGTPVLRKPFHAGTLTCAVRHALDRAESASCSRTRDEGACRPARPAG